MSVSNGERNESLCAESLKAFRAEVKWWKTLVEMEIEWRRKEIWEIRQHGWTRNEGRGSALCNKRPAAASEWHIGSRVLVPFEGNMSLGTISGTNKDGTFVISLDEGDEINMRPDRILPPSSVHMPRVMCVTVDLPKVGCLYTLDRALVISFEPIRMVTRMVNSGPLEFDSWGESTGAKATAYRHGFPPS
jgi:hypothetical protein